MYVRPSSLRRFLNAAKGCFWPFEWLFEDDWLVITKIETDQDRDRQAELDDMFADYLKDKARTHSLSGWSTKLVSTGAAV